MKIYEDLVDRLLQYFTSPKYADEVRQGKIEFFEGAGILDEESSDFEMKMHQFGEWFIFERELNQEGQPAIQVCQKFSELNLTDEQLLLIKNLQASRHSLFEFLKFSKNDLHIRDVFSNYKLILKGSHLKFGFNKGDIFEARLIPHEDSFCFTRAFSFHPFEAKKYILKKTKAMEKLSIDEVFGAREKLILKIFKMKNKYEQYAHISADKIYSDSTGLRI